MSAEVVLDVVLVGTGLVLVLFTAVDLLWTTLWPDGGAGPLTARVAAALWAVLAYLSSRGSHGHALRSVAGPVVLVTFVALWVLLLYAGWALVFASTETGIVDAATKAPADLKERLYFVGYSMFTLGNGDLQPVGAQWQLATVLATANGLLLITLAVTYLVPVVSAATAKRALAGQITSLGSDAVGFVAAAWGRHGFAALEPQLVSITSTLGVLGNQHLSYPVLHFFHGRPAQHSSSVAVVLLDEALTIMRYGVAERVRPEPAVLTPARGAVGSYLDTLAAAHVSEGETTPPPPDLGPLRRAGIPVVEDQVFADALEKVAQRRRMLLGMVDAEGWSWDHVR